MRPTLAGLLPCKHRRHTCFRASTAAGIRLPVVAGPPPGLLPPASRSAPPTHLPTRSPTHSPTLPLPHSLPHSSRRLLGRTRCGAVRWRREQRGTGRCQPGARRCRAGPGRVQGAPTGHPHHSLAPGLGFRDQGLGLHPLHPSLLFGRRALRFGFRASSLGLRLRWGWPYRSDSQSALSVSLGLSQRSGLSRPGGASIIPGRTRADTQRTAECRPAAA